MNDKIEKLLINLPKPQFILGKEKQYFNSAVLITFIKIEGIYHFLFQKRALNIKQEGEVCFPGGKYEPEIDESYKETAIRETIEELGVKRDDIEIKGELGTLVAPMGATVDSFLAVLHIDSLGDLNINKKEVEKVITVPVSYFLENPPEKYKVRLEIQPSYIDKDGKKIILLPAEELGLAKRYTQPWGGKKYSVYIYKINGETIWGITAQLVNEIIGLIKK